ncbi:hypothetical protein [Sutcliffiella horikoshii]|uniref:hypothetical protein n=1 Tax=Sutcliffiella horikoshii TaxID=79883 RepID=UPI00384E1CB4
MEDLDVYRTMPLDEILEQQIVKSYLDMLEGKRKTLPRGSLEKDSNIIILFRYVIEYKLQLVPTDVTFVTKEVIKQNKLFGLLNYYRSVPKLIKFVYKDKYEDTDFQRVPKGHWEHIQNIKLYFEKCLQQHGYTMEDIPAIAKVEVLVSWGFSNPLKRYGDSPFQLINAIYPNKFNVFDFNCVPQRYWEVPTHVRARLKEVIQKENINFYDMPAKVTQEFLLKHGFSAVLKKYNGSPSEMILDLFPTDFNVEHFSKCNGYWKDIKNVRKEINSLVASHNIPKHEIPKYFTKAFFEKHGLYGLIQEYNASPFELVSKLYPGQFDVTEFQRVPNRHWYCKENRIQALRNYCLKRGITREVLPKLSRAYFKKEFPRFISVVDRHYDSKFYLWIIEAFPEYTFSLEEFQLLQGEDGQICDSREELQIHNFLCNWLVEGEIVREKIKFTNTLTNECYFPDWIIEWKDKSIIVEYFGLYHSNKYKGYKEKSDRKIEHFQNLDDYIFIPIMPEDFLTDGFSGIKNKFNSILKV